MAEVLKHVQRLGVIGDQDHLVRGGGLDDRQQTVEDRKLPRQLWSKLVGLLRVVTGREMLQRSLETLLSLPEVEHNQCLAVSPNPANVNNSSKATPTYKRGIPDQDG